MRKKGYTTIPFHLKRNPLNTYLGGSHQFSVNQFRLNRTHCYCAECKGTDAFEIALHLCIDNLHDIFDANAKLAIFVITGL